MDLNADLCAQDAPADIKAASKAAGLPGADKTHWQPLLGGRTNRLWAFETDGGRYVCKLYRSGHASPLFPNTSGAERTALQGLAGHGLAPEFIADFETAQGACLIYRFVPGSAPMRSEPGPLVALRQLHKISDIPPFRRLVRSSAELMAQADALWQSLPPDCHRRFRHLRPRPADIDFGDPVFLHGDPVPANMIARGTRICLIDWQCPAVGDATEDLAIFLSPAMQQIYAGRPLTPEEEDAALKAYDDADIAVRYQTLAPIYHWRMAAHCLWRAERGDAAFDKAALCELARLRTDQSQVQ